jgi:hypothetical protein
MPVIVVIVPLKSPRRMRSLELSAKYKYTGRINDYQRCSIQGANRSLAPVARKSLRMRASHHTDDPGGRDGARARRLLASPN